MATRKRNLSIGRNPELEALGIGTFYYGDKFANVIYKRLVTLNDSKGVDNRLVPACGLFIEPEPEKNLGYEFSSIVSEVYRFVGHENLVEGVKKAVLDSENSIEFEEAIFSIRREKMYYILVIKNPNDEMSREYDVHPTLFLKNSYDGTLSQKITFGLSIKENGNYKAASLRHRFGELKQVHAGVSNTYSTSSIGSFVNTFSNNMLDVITHNKNRPVSFDNLTVLLDILEKIGKNRREGFSTFLNIQTNSQNQVVSAQRNLNFFDLFIALLRFSQEEKTINARLLMDDLIESTLEVPTRMMNLSERK